MGLNTSGVTRNIALDMFFDMIEHAIGFPHKIIFYCVYGKMFFLTQSFLAVADSDYELSKSTIHSL